MRKITVDELRQLASDQRTALWGIKEPRIYLHWTAGRYDTCFDDYHICITGTGDIMLMTDDLTDILAHTYRRNTGSIGVSMCCAYGANTNDLGEYAPTLRQIETMAQVITALCDGLWLTIDKKHVMTHGEAADNEDGWYAHEPYGPQNGCERWDLEFLGTPESPIYNPWATDGSRGGDVLRGKANWYRQNAQ